MIKIIDYRTGNAVSVLHAVNHLGFNAEFASKAYDLVGASHIILPGVGSAAETMESLHEMKLIEPLEDMVLNKKIPFLGICIGMQILFEESEEGDVNCLGWIKGRVVRFDGEKVRVPQMGWNQTLFLKDIPHTSNEDYFYFVNSYHAVPKSRKVIWGIADYGGEFTSAVHSGNIYATQFHIEKSGEAGLSLLKGFLTEGRME